MYSKNVTETTIRTDVEHASGIAPVLELVKYDPARDESLQEPAVQEVLDLRRAYVAKKDWVGAEDPDRYDKDSQHVTNTLAIPDLTGGYKASLRLTHLGSGHDKQAVIDQCLSVEMLGQGTDLSDQARQHLLSDRHVHKDDEVYDMTRFVVDTAKYSEDPRRQIPEISADFMIMIGGAVAVSNQEAYSNNKVVWLFTAEAHTVNLLEHHGIVPEILAEGKNDYDMQLYFCMIRPAESLAAVEESDAASAERAKTHIHLGKAAISV